MALEEGGEILGRDDMSGDGLEGGDGGRSLGDLKGGPLADDVSGLTDRD